jgi:hypothetical protein
MGGSGGIPPLADLSRTTIPTVIVFSILAAAAIAAFHAGSI